MIVDLTTYQCVDDWSKILNCDGDIDVVYRPADFQKAFDHERHHILLMKLKSYELNEDIRRWNKSFLTNRQQRVKIKGISSLWNKVK